MRDWGQLLPTKRIDQTLLPDKDFYSNLNKEDITDADYKHTQKGWENFEIKSLGYYLHLYVQSVTLLLADVFESFHKCTELCELASTHFFISIKISIAGMFKKSEVELRLIIDIDMLLMVEKGIRDGVYHTIQRYAGANNKYMKEYSKNKELIYHVFVRKQSIWMGNVSKITYR